MLASQRTATPAPGRIVTPGDAGWNSARQAFNLFVDQRPAAVALPANEHEVSAVVGLARERDLRIAVQATGHNAGPLGSLQNTILLNTSALTGSEIDADGARVRVAAGTRWREVIQPLSDAGLAALHGSSPNVGVVGYTLGGGIGWLARRYGMQSGSVSAIELITADGDSLRCDTDHEPELFWALRGGGGNFGVVTAIEFAAYPVAELYAGAMLFGFERASEVLGAWSELLPGLPEELTTWAMLMHLPDLPFVPEPLRGGSFVAVLGTFVGDQETGSEWLRPLRRLGPQADTFAMVTPAALADLAMDPPEPVPYLSGHQLLDVLSPPAIDRVVAAAGRGSGLVAIQFRHLRGAIARPGPSAGARATLPGEVATFALGMVPDKQAAALVRSSLNTIEEILAPHQVGLNPSFVEQAIDPRFLFDPETLARLRAVKARYDSSDLFSGNHHISPTVVLARRAPRISPAV